MLPALYRRCYMCKISVEEKQLRHFREMGTITGPVCHKCFDKIKAGLMPHWGCSTCEAQTHSWKSLLLVKDEP